METLILAYQQESANPMFDMERPSFRRQWRIWNRCAKIQESLYKPFEVSMASEFSPVETVNKSIDPCLSIGNSSLVFFTRAAACAPKTDMLLCCTQNENHDEHQGIDGPIFQKIQILNLSPQYILPDDKMVAKISDFGLSRRYVEENVPNMKSFIGTLGYMAPEYKKGEITLDPFSLGVIIVEILLGHVDKATAAAQNSSNKTMQDAVSTWEEHLLTPYCPRRRTKSLAQTMKLNRKRSISNVKSLKSKVTTSGNGGVDINFGSRTIHVRKSLSVHHPLVQMVLFANHLHGNEFCCPKSMAPKSITDMVERSPSSASRNAYEAGWVPAEHKRELSQFARAFGTRILVKTVDTSSHNSLPVLFEKLTKKVTSSNVSSTQRAGRDIFVVDYKDWMCDAGEMKTWNNTCFASSNTDKAPTGADLRQQLAQNNLADETNEKPRSNSAPSDTSSDQTERVPKKHKLTDDESQNNSDPNSCIAEGDTNEEAKRSGKWYVATGAAQHATGDCRVITNLQALENNDLCVHAADGTIMPVRGIGSVVTDTVVLPDVYYVPGLWTNLVSVGQLARLDYCIGFSRGACHISDAAGTVVGTAHARGDGLYEVDFLRVPLGITSTGS